MKNQNQNENTNSNNETNETNHDARQIGGKQRLLLPKMKTAENALELCSLEQDHFYLSAFTIQMWLGRVIASITAEYAQKKDPRTRALQSGQTWRIFLETTAHMFVREDAHKPKYGTPIKPESLDQTDLCSFISDIVRLTEYEDAYAEIVRETLVRYVIENGGPSQMLTGDHFHAQSHSVLQRMCDWLDSILHLQTHMAWHLAPVAFDPDREKRHLARLGFVQRHFASAAPQTKTHWLDCMKDATERFAGSPKMRALAEGLASDAMRVWNYRDVDTAVITLWPLVKRHNWTYADLLKVIRPTLKRPTAYPCDREQSFATYCTGVLGLRKIGKGTSANGNPPGTEIARRLLGLSK